ncbi:MAG: hypothetical protein HZC40_13810 [Chloroflexi bacterium]|nr:hypothetical protein [Chloroflexota bacterium]
MQKNSDEHLNLFFSYNRDNEFIENNLTRAFIVCLSILSGQTRNYFFRSKRLAKANDPLNKTKGIGDLDFTAVQFALQGNIDPQLSKNSAKQILLTITSDLTIDSEADTVLNDEVSGESIPDGWIYDDSHVFCILIESKIGTNSLDRDQIKRHVTKWFGSTLQNLQSTGSWYSTTWIDILGILDELLKNHLCSNPIEEKLIHNLMDFIGFYGYHMFDGIHLSRLNPSPDFRLLD